MRVRKGRVFASPQDALTLPRTAHDRRAKPWRCGADAKSHRPRPATRPGEQGRCPHLARWVRVVHRTHQCSGGLAATGAQSTHDTRAVRAQRQIDLAATIRGLTVADAVGLALRDHRRRLGLSQRAYARLRSKTPSSIARLESSAGRSQLTAVIEALDGTGFELALVRPGDEDTGSTPAAIVGPDSWPMTELLARVRDGSRRFPAHHEAQAVVSPPSWWWHREFFAGRPGPEPQWYAPRPTPQEPDPLRSDTA